MVQCNGCGRWFTVIWSNDGCGPPEYCPMCGDEWDVYNPEAEDTE